MSKGEDLPPVATTQSFETSSLNAVLGTKPDEQCLRDKLGSLSSPYERLLMLKTRLLTLAELDADGQLLVRTLELVEMATVDMYGSYDRNWRAWHLMLCQLATQLYGENPRLDKCEPLTKRLALSLAECWSQAPTMEDAKASLFALVMACGGEQLTKQLAASIRRMTKRHEIGEQFAYLQKMSGELEGQRQRTCLALMNALKHAHVSDLDDATMERLMRLAPCARRLVNGDFAEVERFARLVDMRALARLRFENVFRLALRHATDDMDAIHAAILGGSDLSVNISIRNGSSLTVELIITVNVLLSGQVVTRLISWAGAWVKDQTADGPLTILRECREEVGLPNSYDDTAVISLAVPGEMHNNLAAT